MIEVLLFRLFTEPDLHQAVIKHRQQLKWVATHGRDDGLYDVLDTILRYDEQHGKLPEKPTALLEFCEMSADALLIQRSEALRPDLKRMKEVATQELRAEFTDIDVLIDHTVAEARKRYHVYIYERAKSLVNQGPS